MKEHIISLLIRLLASTWRYRIEGEVPAHPCVTAFWHGEMLAVWKYFSRTQAVGVTSLSKDGDILARLLLDWKYTVLRGSSSQGAKEVLEGMTLSATTANVLVTPDGPRGPKYIFKAGALIAARRAAVPLFMCTVSCLSSIRLRASWDEFQIPLPFAKITLSFSRVETGSKDSSPEQINAILAALSVAYDSTE